MVMHSLPIAYIPLRAAFVRQHNRLLLHANEYDKTPKEVCAHE